MGAFLMNTLGASLFSYLSQLSRPSGRLVKKIERIYQACTVGPFHGYPCAVLYNLKWIGGHELKNQDLAAQAAMYRLACKHSDTIHDELAMCENMVIGQGDVNNVVLSSKVRNWFGAEILRRVHRNYEMVDDMSNLCTLRDNKNIQKLAFAAIHDSAEAAGHEGFIMAIGRRMRSGRTPIYRWHACNPRASTYGGLGSLSLRA